MDSVVSYFRLAIDTLLAGKALQRFILIISLFSSVVLLVQQNTYVNSKMQEEYKYARYTEHKLYAEDIIALALSLKGSEYKVQIDGENIDLNGMTRVEIEAYLVENKLDHDMRYEVSMVKDAGRHGAAKSNTYTFYVTTVSGISSEGD